MQEIEFVWLSLNAFASNITHEYKDNSIIPYIWLYFYPLYSSPVPPEPGKFFMCESSDENTNKYVVIMLAWMAAYLFVFEEHRDSDRTQFWSMSSERRLRERGQRFRLSPKQNKTFFYIWISGYVIITKSLIIQIRQFISE